LLSLLYPAVLKCYLVALALVLLHCRNAVDGDGHWCYAGRVFVSCRRVRDNGRSVLATKAASCSKAAGAP